MRLLRVAAVLVLAGCGTSPVPDLYTLTAMPGPAHATRPISLELRRIGLAGYLDRPEIVRGTTQNRLRVSDIDRWGESLTRMMERVLTEDLVERLPQASVFAESGAISTRPDMVLEIDIQRLDEDSDGTLVLLAQIAVRPDGTNAGGANATARTVRIVRAVGDTTTEAQVSAMSVSIGELADALAGQIASAH